MKYRDLTGERFTRLLVLKRQTQTGEKVKWLCRCDCGKLITVTTADLKNEHTKSCGCYKIDRIKKHGIAQTRIYHIYRGMMQRCCYTKSDSYRNYGGIGIQVCKEWKDNPMAFYEWAINNGYNNNLTLDRIDNNGNYEPSNCRWVTMKQQNNNKRNNHTVCFNGEEHTIEQWAEILKINRKTLRTRLWRGWSIERAFQK